MSSTSESSVNMSDILHGRIYLQREENQINNDTFPAHMKRISKKEERNIEFEYSSPYAFKKHTIRGHPDGDTTHWRELKSLKENPQKLTQLSSRSHPRHFVGKRTAKKDTIIDITSDSQVNSNFPNRWSPASLTFNNYFYLFLYLYIT